MKERGFPHFRRWSVLWGAATGLEYRLIEQPLLALPLQKQSARPVERQPAKDSITFLVDTLTLRESRRLCCSQEGEFREVFHYAAGLKVTDRLYVMGHVIPVDFSEQSAVGVRVEDMSNIQAFETLDRAGLPLTAHLHSHPGYGREANHPSSTDRAFQERLERGGAIAIGGIFSRDGYLRFFAGKGREFRVVVRGNHVVRVEPNLFLVSDAA